MNVLVAVGGTGQHVALSYVDLEALGYLFLPLNSRPSIYLLDADQVAGDDEGSSSAWQKVKDATELMTTLDGNRWNLREIPPYLDTLPGPDFEKTVCEPLREWLFTPDQLQNTKFKNGYYGQAAVAATLFGHTFQVLQNLQGSPVQTLLGTLQSGCHVFVAGSAVGGTGAGCLPRLVHCLSQQGVTGLMACVFLPWFRLEGSDDGSKSDAISRNNEMNERFSSGLLYFQNRLAREAATLILGHPNTAATTSSRSWKGDTRQPMHGDLTLPSYAAIAAMDHFMRSVPLSPGLYAMVRPQVKDEGATDTLMLPSDAPVFGGDGKDGKTYLGQLVALNVDLCFEVAQVLTYLSWPANRPLTLRPESFRIPELDHIGRTLLRHLKDLISIKWGAIKRLHDSDPTVVPPAVREHYRELDAFMRPGGRHAVVSVPEGLETLRRLLPAQRRWPDHGTLFREWAQTVTTTRPNWVVTPGASSRRCLPSSLPANVVGFAARKVGEIEDITNNSVKDEFIVFRHVKPYAIPSVDALAFVLDHYYADPSKFLHGLSLKEVIATAQANLPKVLRETGLVEAANWDGANTDESTQTGPIAAEQGQSGRTEKELAPYVWAELSLLVMRGVAAGIVRVDQVPTQKDHGPVRLEDRYNEAVGLPALALGKQVAFYLDGDVPILLGVSDPRVLLAPVRTPCGIDGSKVKWGTVVGRMMGDPRLVQAGPADKILKAWLLLLEDLRQVAFPGARPPGWLTYFQDHPLIARAPSATYEFALVGNPSDPGEPLPHVCWPTSAAGAPDSHRDISLPLPRMGSREDVRFRSLLKGFGFSVRDGLPTGQEPGAPLAGNLRGFLNDPQKCPPFKHFSGSNLQHGEMRAAVWEDKYPKEAEAIRFGYLFVPGTPPNAYRVTPPSGCSSLMIFPVPQVTQCSSLTSLGASANDPQVVLPDYPVKAEFADLIDPAYRHEVARTGSAGANYTFRLKGYPDVLTWPMQVNDMRVCTILLWPRFKTEHWQTYYLLSFFKETAARLHVYMETTERAETTLAWVKPVEHHHFAQPLFDENLAEETFRGGRPRLFAFITGSQSKDDPAEGVGLFRLALEKAPPVPAEQWGVDFGTSNSVVAVHAPGHHATLTISTDGRLDQTHVIVRSSEPVLNDWNWFPTFDSRGARQPGQESPVFPSQMISVSMKPGLESVLGNVQGMRYKADYTINSPVPDRAAVWKDRVVPHFKWISEGNNRAQQADLRVLRKAYLLHLLETSLALRAGLQNDVQQIVRGIPQKIVATFSLPLRMADQCSEFQHDMRKVGDLLQLRCGVSFTAAFQWESLAGSVPQAAQANAIYAVADLGGGSLDLWGAYADGNSYPYSWAESIKLGGADLLAQIDSDCNLRGTDSAAALIRENLQAVQAIILGHQGATRSRDGFFDLASECVARWIAAIAVCCRLRKLRAGPVTRGPRGEHGTGSQEAEAVYPVHLMLLGMGWSINESVVDDLEGYIRETIGGRANELLAQHVDEVQVRVSVQPYGDRNMTWVERKAYLAEAIAKFPGVPDLTEEQPPKTLSMAGLLDGPTEQGTYRHIDGNTYTLFRWFDELPYRIQAGLRFLVDQIGQPVPQLPEHSFPQNTLASMVNDLNQRMPVGNPRLLRGSPFRLVVEPLSRNSKASRPPARQG